MRRRLFLASALLPLAARALENGNSDVEVRVQVDGRAVDVSAHFLVAASPLEVWEVLTDFENMARFVSNVESSEVVSRQGNVLQIRQRGRARFGPLSYRFDSLREMTLMPHERIQSRQLRGELLAEMTGDTRIIPAGSSTQVVYHVRSVSKQEIPPIIGKAFIRSETEEQFMEMQAEILRRHFEAMR